MLRCIQSHETPHGEEVNRKIRHLGTGHSNTKRLGGWRGRTQWLKVNGCCGHRRFAVKRLLAGCSMWSTWDGKSWYQWKDASTLTRQAWKRNLLNDFCPRQCPPWEITEMPTRMAKASSPSSSIRLRESQAHCTAWCSVWTHLRVPTICNLIKVLPLLSGSLCQSYSCNILTAMQKLLQWSR